LSKLVASREKDFAFAAAMLESGLIDPTILARRIDRLPVSLDSLVQKRLHSWLKAWSKDTDQTDLIPEIRQLSVVKWPLEMRPEVRAHRCLLRGSASIRDQIRDRDATGRVGTVGDGCDVDGWRAMNGDRGRRIRRHETGFALLITRMSQV
jgi:hypothetical protein